MNEFEKKWQEVAKEEDRAKEIEEDLKSDICYCEVCNGCGEVGCDGIERFLNEHVEGKTNCEFESSYLSDIKQTYKDIEELYEKGI